MEYIIESFCASIFFAYIFYKWANKNVDYFAKRNIAHVKPFFLLGTNLTVLEGRETTQELLIRLHNQFKKEKIYGYHDFRTPKFVISDPQLIEKVTVKDFEYFLNRCENQAILSDDIASRMLCAANDKTWIEEKAMVSHLFTEDKISQVFEVVNECNRAAIMYLKRKITTEGKEIDLEDYFHRYSNDVIASAAFGVKINSFNNRDNEFFNMAADLLRTRSLFAALKAFYLTISPHVYKVYRLNRVYIKALQFVRNIFSRIFGSHQGHQTLSGDPKDAQKAMEFTEIIRGFLTKFSSAIKSVVLIVFPQIALIVNFIFFIQSIRSYVKNFFNPKPKERKEERITPTTDEIKPRDNKNKVVRGGQVVLRNIAGGVKSVILAIFPQLILISRLYLFIKTAINYFRGKTVGQAVLQKKKKLSKVESALLKLERFVVVMKLLILTNFPAVKKLVKIRVLNTKALNYMKCLATQTLQSKEGESIVRQDMIHYMLESRKKIGAIIENEEIVSSPIEDASKVTDNEIAQCIMFLFAGLQQISKLLCVIVYELMKNPDIQEKLLEEALKMKDELKGAEISYETLTKMTYLDMVVREALRKWPSEPILNRVCTKPYTLTDAEGRTIQEFKPRDIICVSVYASHFDEEYFENPFTFDPERFSNKKKSNIKAYTYFPFGVGARNCKGKNFGLIVVKLMLYHLILEFNFSCGLRSTLDLFAATRKIQLKQSEFFWMKLLPRSKEIDLEESNVCLSSNEVIEKQA